MDRTTLQDSLYPECPIRNILARMGDKWSLLTLYTLAQGGTLRFGALRRAIPDISQKMLAATLRTLTEDGLVVRRLYPEIPPRTEYSLTERARTLPAPPRRADRLGDRALRSDPRRPQGGTRRGLKRVGFPGRRLRSADADFRQRANICRKRLRPAQSTLYDSEETIEASGFVPLPTNGRSRPRAKICKSD